MVRIPVKFIYNGKECEGTLSPVAGMGAGDHWFLDSNSGGGMGQMHHGQRGWQFGDQKGYHPELIPVLRAAIIKHQNPKLLPLLIDNFHIILRRHYKDYKILVSQTMVTETKEQFSVVGRTNIVVLESNRPTWYQKGVRHRQEWTYISGNYKYLSDIEELQQLIDEHLKKLVLSSK